jgi:hypothetical protein
MLKKPVKPAVPAKAAEVETEGGAEKEETTKVT